MDYTIIRRGSCLKRVIVDRHNEISPQSRIGFDAVKDRARYHVSEGGVVVLSRGVDMPEKGRYRI